MAKTEESDIERIVRKCEELITCEVPQGKCEVRGDYWRCYMGNYRKCHIYLNWALKNRERET